MEKEGYREMLEALNEKFPGRVTITPKEAADVMGTDVRVVYSAIARVKNPMPCKRLAQKKIVIPIPALARWMV